MNNVKTTYLQGVQTITVKGIKGDAGKDGKDAPKLDEEAIIKKVVSKIPKAKDGKDGQAGKDGKPPSEQELKDLIKPFIPTPIAGKDGSDGSPDSPNEVVQKVNQADKKIKVKQIEGLPKFLKAVDDLSNYPVGGAGGGGPTYVWLDDGVRVSDHVTELNFGTGITASYSNGRITLSATASGGANVATEKLTPVASGSSITLDLTVLAHTYSTIQWVAKNGQILDSSDATFGWSQGGDIITVLNAFDGDIFLINYTYA